MSLIQSVSSLSPLDSIYLPNPEVVATSPSEGESSLSRWRRPNNDQSSTPPSTFLPSSSSSALEAPPTSRLPLPLPLVPNVLSGPKAKSLSSPPLFCQEVPPILFPTNSISFDSRLPLELDQDPNLPQLEEGETEGGIIEERIVGLLRAIHEESVGEGGGRGRRRRRRGSDHELGEELEEGRVGIESRRSSTRTEDGLLPKTPLDGGELVRLGEEGGELAMEKRTWTGGGREWVELGGEKAELGSSFGIFEGGRGSDPLIERKGDHVGVKFEEDEIELRSLEDGVGSLWV